MQIERGREKRTRKEWREGEAEMEKQRKAGRKGKRGKI